MTTDLVATKDTFVTDGTGASTNNGTSATLIMKQHTVNYDRNDWVSFNISGYSGITAAKLRMYVSSVGVESTNNVPISVYYAPTASDSWSETALTWNNVPSPGNAPTGPLASISVNNANSGTWIEYDVTNSVKTDTDGVATFVLSSYAGGDTNHGVNFSSREGTNPPVLRITQ